MLHVSSQEKEFVPCTEIVVQTDSSFPKKNQLSNNKNLEDLQPTKSKEILSLSDKFCGDDWDCLVCLKDSFYRKQNVGLAELFAALFTQFGQSDGYDNYKCSFSYSFQDSISKMQKRGKFGTAMSQ